jgi:prepilin-type N-terminal cleavage/methylation domain-containing protein
LKRPEGRQRSTDEAFTITELLVVLLVFGILSTVVMVTMTNTLGIANQTSATYTGVNQVLNLSTTLESLVRSEVEPGPPSVTAPPVPVPGFAVNGETINSLTFFSDIGSPYGPAQIVVVKSSVANFCTGKCPIPTYSFTVVETVPTPGTCPGTQHGSGCVYPAANAKRVIGINNVANTSSSPIFTYTILTNGVPQTITPAQLTSGFFSTCNSSGCPSDTIQSVDMSLSIAVQGAPNTAAYNTTAYRLSSASYQYSSVVG